MKVVADEGVEASIVSVLRAEAHQVTYFAEELPSSPDEAVLAAARAAGSLLLTGGKDFGELVFRQGLSSAGVVLIRLHGLSPQSKARVVADALSEHGREILGNFCVISPGLLRIRPRDFFSERRRIALREEIAQYAAPPP